MLTGAKSGCLVLEISRKLLFGISEKLLWNRRKLMRNGKLRVYKYKYKNNPSLEINKNRLKFFANLQDGMREPAQKYIVGHNFR